MEEELFYRPGKTIKIKIEKLNRLIYEYLGNNLTSCVYFDDLYFYLREKLMYLVINRNLLLAEIKKHYVVKGIYIYEIIDIFLLNNHSNDNAIYEKYYHELTWRRESGFNQAQIVEQIYDNLSLKGDEFSSEVKIAVVNIFFVTTNFSAYINQLNLRDEFISYYFSIKKSISKIANKYDDILLSALIEEDYASSFSRHQIFTILDLKQRFSLNSHMEFLSRQILYREFIADITLSLAGVIYRGCANILLNDVSFYKSFVLIIGIDMFSTSITDIATILGIKTYAVSRSLHKIKNSFINYFASPSGKRIIKYFKALNKTNFIIFPDKFTEIFADLAPTMKYIFYQMNDIVYYHKKYKFYSFDKRDISSFVDAFFAQKANIISSEDLRVLIADLQKRFLDSGLILTKYELRVIVEQIYTSFSSQTYFRSCSNHERIEYLKARYISAGEDEVVSLEKLRVLYQSEFKGLSSVEEEKLKR